MLKRSIFHKLLHVRPCHHRSSKEDRLGILGAGFFCRHEALSAHKMKTESDDSGSGSGMTMEVDGTKPSGRPWKTWWDSVKEDELSFGLSVEDA